MPRANKYRSPFKPFNHRVPLKAFIKLSKVLWAGHLPFVRDRKQQTKPMQSDVAIAGPFKILLVDDDPATRILVTRILRQPDYAFTEADHAIQALDLLEKSSFDVIITDILMSDLEGIEFALCDCY